MISLGVECESRGTLQGLALYCTEKGMMGERALRCYTPFDETLKNGGREEVRSHWKKITANCLGFLAGTTEGAVRFTCRAIFE